MYVKDEQEKMGGERGCVRERKGERMRREGICVLSARSD